MAKSCNVCHQSFDDQLDKCPHCGAASEASTPPPAPNAQQPDDVAIDWNLTDLPASASAISHIKSPMAKAVEPDTEENIDIDQAARDDAGSEVRLGESLKKDSTGELSSLDPIRGAGSSLVVRAPLSWAGCSGAVSSGLPSPIAGVDCRT